MKLKIGTIAREPNYCEWEVIGHHGELNLLKCHKSHTESSFNEGRDVSYLGGFTCDGWEVISEPTEKSIAPIKKSKKNKIKKFTKRPLYFVSSRNGMTHKGIVPAINKKGISRFGNSVTQALSKYEDQYGKKIDLNEAIVFKLIPHGIRTDKSTGKYRIGREIK